MAAEWYYTKDGTKFGPIDAATLKQFADSGVLQTDDLVWKQGAKQWVTAASVKGLFDRASVAPSNNASESPAMQSATSSAQTPFSASVAYSTSAGAAVGAPGGSRAFRKRRTFPSLGFVAGVFTLLAVLIMLGGVISFVFIVSNAVRLQNEVGGTVSGLQVFFAIVAVVVAAALAVIYLAVAESIKLGLYAVSLLEDIRNQG